MEIDYEKVEKINEGLDYCNKRREKINEQIKKLPLSFGDELIEISNKRALEGYDQELKQIDKQYQHLLKERDKCFEDTNKEETKMEDTKAESKRLTKKDLTDVPSQTNTVIILERTFGKTLARRIIAEMISYKDIEDKLGVGLDVLYEALTKRIAYIREDGTIGHCFIEHFVPSMKGQELHTRGKSSMMHDKSVLAVVSIPYKYGEVHLGLKDYGKKAPGGWALTKEELE